MVIYHLGFPASTYLATQVFCGNKVLECQPLADEVAGIESQIEGEKEFLFHIDLSVQQRVPNCREALMEALSDRGLILHNAFHIDQRKRLLQQASAQLGFKSLAATQDGDPDEMLLVKTDLNVGGGPERRTLRRFPGMAVPPLPSRITAPSEYYAAKRCYVPDEVWLDKTLQVEVCVKNSKGLVLRTFWNQGKGVVSVIENPHEIIKKRNEKCRRWNYTEGVDALTENAFQKMAAYAKHLNVSFFAADFVVDEDQSIYLVDLNLTPQWIVSSAPAPNNMTPDLPIYGIPKALQFA
jgi:hypothetical protein